MDPESIQVSPSIVLQPRSLMYLYMQMYFLTCLVVKLFDEHIVANW